MKKLRITLMAIITGMVITAPVFGTVMVSAQTFDNSKTAVCNGIADAGGDTCGTTSSTLNNVIKAVINILSIVVGIASIIMIIIGGLKYITSGGEAAAITSAKNTIIYALIGLVIVVLAQIIVHFVINNINKTPTTTTSQNANPDVQ